MQQPASRPLHDKSDRSVRSVAIKPGKSAKMELGEYPSEDAIPEFSFDYLPDQELIGQSKALIPTPNGIRVTYHFQNYGPQTAMAFVKRTE